MKWWPGKCKPGDMIRVKLGPLYHHGIFVSGEEVIQFGHPSRDRNAVNPGQDIRVFASTAAEFADGNMVEVARLDLRERLRRYSPRKTIRLARARLGENGYDILRNNCEHFANMCVFGKKICLQTDNIIAQWKSRPIMDVYLCPLEECADGATSVVELREKHLSRVKDPALLRQKRASWQLLEYAMMRSCSQKMSEAAFTLSRHGKWSCDKLHFSITHTDHWVAVAVSNEPVGLDAEEAEAFARRDLTEIAQLICTGKEAACAPAGEELRRLWLCKESIYKCAGKGRFDPRRIPADAQPTVYLPQVEGTPLALAVAGKHLARLRLYRYSAEGTTPIGLKTGEGNP